eukprot:TRINITY_DN8669_c0_g4_i1.p1 TRINITY_DN8669_c0_g4~~TRINITY_DN8669_c0_g4_i1.p1  ORF type:complete len:968 (+),score=229.14 TRINITY_DN8669_c0_g4_i1:945-3848(+)
MAREGFHSSIYHGEACLGEVHVIPQYDDSMLVNGLKEAIRVSHLSAASERCPPLAVLHTITSNGVFIKVELNDQQLQADQQPLKQLYNACLKEARTAVVPVGEKEVLLVAMQSTSRHDQVPCFWGYEIPLGMYNACLGMLNLRCLAIVFDLDETLIVANTLRSFEDRIDALQRRLAAEPDAQRAQGIMGELRRYQEDRAILKQYADSDQIFDNGRVIKAEIEYIPSQSEKGQRIARPLIRLPDRNMILTRINPNIRDTSVLVRLRPAWEELRTYLTLKGRKRFEVYICTMSERDYALEMWRLLDSEARLINPGELLDRVLCVKPGLRKSLLNVFHDGFCHPKLAMVIDDRLKVWEDRDQPRVHVVPAFAPYYAPQAETSCPVPVLCVARNVACNVRGGFFKDFDEVLLQKIAEVFYEDNIGNLPPAPDVSNYLISDEDQNANRELPLPEGMADSEVERRLNPQEITQVLPSGNISNGMESQVVIRSLDQLQAASLPAPTIQARIPRAASVIDQNQEASHSIPAAKPFLNQNSSTLETGIQGSPAREEGEVPESELDPDTRRRLLILQHGQDTAKHNPSEPAVPFRPMHHISLPTNQVPGGWLGAEEEMSPRQIPRPPGGHSSPSDSFSFDNQRYQQPPFFHGPENPLVMDRSADDSKRRIPDEGCFGDDRLKTSHVISDSFSHSEDKESTLGRPSSNLKALQGNVINAPTCFSALNKIAEYCHSKVDFLSSLNSTMELEFSVEVLFDGKKVGTAVGRTKKEAQQKASVEALTNMANHYVSHLGTLGAGVLRGPVDSNLNPRTDEDRLREACSNLSASGTKDDEMLVASTSGQLKFTEQRLSDDSKNFYNAVDALKEMCTMEGLSVVFQDSSAGVADRTESCAQVEVSGQILGKGRGLTWEEAKLEAAEDALRNFKSTFGQRIQRRNSSPRAVSTHSNKRIKSADLQRGTPRIPPSPRRYPKSGSTIP